MTESLPDLPEYPLHGRYALAWKWTPSGVDRLLDAGCAWGYGTRHFTAKSREVVGLEPDPTSAEVFRARYPQLELCESATEDMPLESDSVDVILALDTFEHVRDEQRTLSEMHRVLKRGGVLILSTPHRGAFSFLDPDNSAPRLARAVRRHAPWAMRALNKVRGIPNPAPGTPAELPELPPFHRHYTLRDFRRLLDASPFGDGYTVTDVFRSGLVLETLTANLALYLGFVMSEPVKERLLRPLRSLAGRDYWIPYGPLAYNIAIRVVKTG